MNQDPDSSILPPNWSKELASLQRLAIEEVAAGVQEFQNKAATAFCEIAIHAWRMQRRMTDRMSKEVKEEHKAMHRSVAGILETLAGMGCTLRDREGEFYDYGLPEKVVAAEKRAGITREMVAETIRPSILFGDQLVKPGEIVIAVPEETAKDEAKSPETQKNDLPKTPEQPEADSSPAA